MDPEHISPKPTLELSAQSRHDLQVTGTFSMLAHRLECHKFHSQMMATPRYSNPLRLVAHGYRAFSQNDEDGILEEIFRRIGVTTRRFFEVGVEGGVECNTLNLLLSGWTGTWVEAELGHRPSVESKLSSWLQDERLRVIWDKVSPNNINTLLGTNNTGLGNNTELDLLSIDVDGHDYWIWQAVHVAKPRVVAIEYNAALHPPLSVVVPFQAEQTWDGTNYFGASLAALEKMARTKGYCLVGCCFSGVNAFFVREDLVAELFLRPFTAHNHFEPPRYFMQYPSGHPPNVGPYVQV